VIVIIFVFLVVIVILIVIVIIKQQRKTAPSEMAKAPLRSFCLKAEILCKEEAESEAGRSFLVAAGASDGKVRLELLLPPRTPGLSRAPGLSEFFQICELPSEHGPALSLALCAVPPHVDGSGDSGVGGGDSGGGGGEGAVPVLLLVGSTDGAWTTSRRRLLRLFAIPSVASLYTACFLILMIGPRRESRLSLCNDT